MMTYHDAIFSPIRPRLRYFLPLRPGGAMRSAGNTWPYAHARIVANANSSAESLCCDDTVDVDVDADVDTDFGGGFRATLSLLSWFDALCAARHNPVGAMRFGAVIALCGTAFNNVLRNTVAALHIDTAVHQPLVVSTM